MTGRPAYRHRGTATLAAILMCAMAGCVEAPPRLASPAEPLAFCQELIGAVARDDQSRGIELLAKVGEQSADPEGRAKGVFKVGSGAVSVIAGGAPVEYARSLPGPAEEGFTAIIENWRTADERQIYLGCVLGQNASGNHIVHLVVHPSASRTYGRLADYIRRNRPKPQSTDV